MSSHGLITLLALSDFPLPEYISLFTHSLTEVHLGCFQVWAMMDRSVQSFPVNTKVNHCCMVKVQVVLQETVKLFFRVAAQTIVFLLEMNESSCSLISLPASKVASVLHFTHSKRYVELPHCCFNLQYPNDI